LKRLSRETNFITLEICGGLAIILSKKRSDLWTRLR